jgi:extradiol dioxygenase family protein
MALRPFHLAFPVDDLEAARAFYTGVLGCSVGRSKAESCVFNFHGHQIVAHLVERMPEVATNPVDGKAIPAMHFGLVLAWDAWHAMRDRLEDEGHHFAVGPYLRYEGLPGAQATMFIRDPCGNHLEFKAFKDEAMVFDPSWGPQPEASENAPEA